MMYIESKNDKARIAAISRGVQTQMTNETRSRWYQRYAEDEQLAREMGIPLRYEEVRGGNTNLWRSSY